MATSSFFTEVNITTKEQLEELLDALEESERRAMSRPPRPRSKKLFMTDEELDDFVSLIRARGKGTSR